MYQRDCSARKNELQRNLREQDRLTRTLVVAQGPASTSKILPALLSRLAQKSLKFSDDCDDRLFLWYTFPNELGPEGKITWADEPTKVVPMSAAIARDQLNEAVRSRGLEGFGPHSIRKCECCSPPLPTPS